MAKKQTTPRRKAQAHADPGTPPLPTVEVEADPRRGGAAATTQADGCAALPRHPLLRLDRPLLGVLSGTPQVRDRLDAWQTWAGFDRDRASYPGQFDDADLVRARDDERAALKQLLELLHGDLDASERAAPTVAPWVDDPAAPPAVRPTARLLSALHVLRQQVPALHVVIGSGLEVGFASRPDLAKPVDRDRFDAALDQVRDFQERLLLPALAHVASGEQLEKPRIEAASTTPTSPRERGRQRKEAKARWLADAMLFVTDHPDWADVHIAEVVKRHPSQLSRSEHYQAAAMRARKRGA